MVKRITGAVALQRGSQMLTAQPGTLVLVGDTLRTGPDGSAGVTLADDTLLAAGPDTVLSIDEGRTGAGPSPRAEGRMMAMAASVPLQPGSQQVTIQVQVSYELVDTDT